MTDTDTLFLCRYCAQGYEEKNKVPFHECDACAHCGALATNHPSWIGLRGHVIARHLIGAPRSLTPHEREEQKRTVPTRDPNAEAPLPAGYEAQLVTLGNVAVTSPGAQPLLPESADQPTTPGVDLSNEPSETKTAILS